MNYLTARLLKMAREEKLFRLIHRASELKRNGGWNDAGIYDRFWKKDLAKLTREIKAVRKSLGMK